MIDFIDVSVAFGAQTIFKNASFKISKGERVGIVGPNGAGKSTIFALITGELAPDHGEVAVERYVTIGHLHQQLTPKGDNVSLLEYAENALPELQDMQREIDTIEAELHRAPVEERSRLLRRLGEVQSSFEHRGGYDLSSRAQAILCGLGFEPTALREPFDSFSGGWQMRAELARALVARPQLLLLDEPTNFLDIPAVEWLQRFLRDFSGTLLLIAHDRYLLNTLTTATLEVAGGCVTRYPGNYDFYIRDCALRHAQIEAAQANQNRRREQIERFVERFRAKNTKSSQVQSRIKMLEKMEEEDIVVPRRFFRAAPIRLRPPAHCGAEIVRMDDAGLSYDGGQSWVLRHLDLRIERGEKLALVGLNGQGKTTLLRALANRLPLSEGRIFRGHKVEIGYQAQDYTETIEPRQTVLEATRSADLDRSEQDVRTLLGSFFFSGDAVEKQISVLSGGEKMRVALARLLMKAPNFLLLDEPTTHLDIPSREALEHALISYTGTLCLVSHDITFVRRVALGILDVEHGQVKRYAGNYDYYLEKKARELAVATQDSPPGSSAEEASRPGDRKALRREKALKREERARLCRPFEERIRTAEKRVAELEKEQAELAARLAQPSAETDYAQINQRLGEIQKIMAKVTLDWESALLALEAVEKKLSE